MQGCLKWNPDERMTPEEALQHPWTQTQDPPALPLQPMPAPPAAGWSPRSAIPASNWLSVGFIAFSCCNCHRCQKA